MGVTAYLAFSYKKQREKETERRGREGALNIMVKKDTSEVCENSWNLSSNEYSVI